MEKLKCIYYLSMTDASSRMPKDLFSGYGIIYTNDVNTYITISYCRLLADYTTPDTNMTKGINNIS